ncbi:MAG: UDP-N-acetylglucosamine 2-epimerase (non-hydrolyzing) [Victivallales bacterium]|nr:UDP-N-acetylglucosamine 2-epimerase (non-hydrolyzing) [Victivallales bacterium]
MVKILTVIGARPQFIKAAMVSRAFVNDPERYIEEFIVHTGQHYDDNMSDIFFRQMGIPRPARQFTLGGGNHGAMTGRMLEALETAMLELKPDSVMVYGDTNSTLAGALAAAKLHIPVIHVEAGLRSFNKLMPEEINRILTDHMSSMLLCPTSVAIKNLANEGIVKGVHHVGDVMYDAALVFGEIAARESDIHKRLRLAPHSFVLATIHRAENTDFPERMKNIIAGLSELAGRFRIVLPLHPRTRKCISTLGLETMLENITITEPLSFLDMVALERIAKVIVTDSGGVQKEAYFHGVPCVTIRNETEWVETVQAGWNVLSNAIAMELVSAVDNAVPGQSINEYGDGHAAEKILNLLKEQGV